MIQIVFVFIFLILLSLKKVEYILFFILIFFVLANKRSIKLSLKVLKSVLFFNVAVSIGYILINKDWMGYVIYINLKVFLLTFYLFWFFERVDVVKFFSFSKDLSYLLTITLSQIYSYKKTFIDFKDAFRARVVSIKNKEKQFILNTFNFFFKKALNDSKERTLAMRARGFFDE